MEEVRNISTRLCPPVLTDFGIVAAVRWFSTEFQRTYPIHVENDVQLQEEQVPELQKMIIFRVVQEAMHNAAKHARPDCITICLRNRDKLALWVQNDGTGFEVDKIDAGLWSL